MKGVERYEISMEEYEEHLHQEEYDRNYKLREELINSKLYTIDLWHTDLINEQKLIKIFGNRKEVEDLEVCIPAFSFGSYTGVNCQNSSKLNFPVKKIIEKLDEWIEGHKSWDKKGEH